MFIRSTAVLVFCLFASFSVAATVQPLMARDALIGKWKATLTTDEGKETTDNISFKAGRFTSENQSKDGFESAAYQDDPAPQGLSAKFTVTLSNKAGDNALWSGFSTGAQIEGTLVITRKDGSKISYALKASKG